LALTRISLFAFWVKRWKALALVFSLALVTSCMVGPNYQTPKAKVADQYTGNPGEAANIADAYWWRPFDDPVLNELIETAYQNNLSLQVAGVRVLQARAQLNRSIGNLFPQQQGLSGALNYSHFDQPSVSAVPGLTQNFTMDQVLFSASWEIDFWGKYRRGIQSDRATFLGTVANYDDALVTLIADVASTYVNIRTAEERIRVAQKNLEVQKESYRVASVQYKYGETDELDVRQAATLYSQTAAQIPPLQNSLNQAKNGLAVLLGEPPGKIDEHLKGSDKIPVVPDKVAVGIPRDLLRRRPDVREAGYTAASKCALIGVAKANMYPAFSLSGAFGFSSNNEGNNSLSDIFMWQSKVAQAGASIVFPIFNYGRLINQVRVQDAEFQQAILNYQNTVLTAQQEVENGLSAFYTQQQALTNLIEAATSARRSTELSLIQYKAGETDYTTVLSTEQAQLSAEDAVASSQGNVVLGLISIYRALGGGWEMRAGHDVISDEVKAEMARRTNWGRMLEVQHHLPKMENQ
jgi:NodT family efflux transporter outer membrane factor (OMF) lipoprotein